MTLATEVKMLHELVSDLDQSVEDLSLDELDPKDTELISYAMIEEARKNLGLVASLLEKKLAKVMPRDYTQDGVGTWEKRKKTNRTQWDKEALLSAVLDSRRFDSHDGSLIEETPLDKVLATWNLPSPRTTILKERGIDPDEFCHTEDAGYSLRLITS